MPGYTDKRLRTSMDADTAEGGSLPAAGAGISRAKRSAAARRGQAADIKRSLGDRASGAQGGRRIIDFPHRHAIQRATGHAIPGTAVVDEALAGGGAITEGTETRFADPEPSVAVAAHEAGHQLQHAGAIRGGGLEPELQAEAISEGVVAGAVDPGLLSGRGARVDSRPRPYTEIDAATQKARGQWQVGSLARVGDTGQTVTTENRDECYADPALLDEANAILNAKRSGVAFTVGGKVVSGDAPDGSGRKTLSAVDVKIAASTAKPGDPQNFWMDCGRSSREVMGPTGGDAAPRAIHGDGSGASRETGAAYKPQALRDEIFVSAGLGKDATSARDAYFALPDADRDAFDRKHGINRYAAPDVGQAYVSARHDEALVPGDAPGFNFHWGGVIMVAGGDRVTFENFAKGGSGYDDKDTRWYFETYGPASRPGQTFHDQNQGSVGGDVADDNVTMATTNAKHADVVARMSTPTLLGRLGGTLTAEEHAATEAELKGRHVAVEVVSIDGGGDWGGDGEVRVEVGGGVAALSDAADVAQGATHRFLFPVKDLWPLGAQLRVAIREEDLIFDDAVLDHIWSTPFADETVDGQGYRVTLSVVR